MGAGGVVFLLMAAASLAARQESWLVPILAGLIQRCFRGIRLRQRLGATCRVGSQCVWQERRGRLYTGARWNGDIFE